MFLAWVSCPLGKETCELDQGREWEGMLEIVGNGAVIRFAFRDGDKRENGDGFQSQSQFLEVQDLCVHRRSRISRHDAVEPRPTEQSDPSRGGT